MNELPAACHRFLRAVEPNRRFFPILGIRLLLVWGILVSLGGSPALVTAQQADETVTVLTGPRANSRFQTGGGAVIADNPTFRYISELLDAAGISMEFRIEPWPRIMQRLNNEANILAFYVIRTPSREQRFRWIGRIHRVNSSFYGHRDTGPIQPRTLDEARSFTVAATRLSAQAEFLQANGFDQLFYLNDASRAPLLLARNRFDLVVLSDLEVQALRVRGVQEANELVPLIPIPELSGDTYFVMSLQADPALVARIEAAYQSTLADGRHEKLLLELSN